MNLKLVFQSGDAVLIGVFLFMVLMSVSSWVLIVLHVVQRSRAKKANAAAVDAIWAAADWSAAGTQAEKLPSPVSELTLDALAAYARFQAAQQHWVSASLPKNAYLEREIRHSMGKIMSRFDFGMTTLASVGATAPFVGLLGTVWGIYHALINISAVGQMSIAAVAGPIGEALVATAFGLFVAIPAVLAYNFFNRSNKNLSRTLHNFAHDLHVRLINENSGGRE